ncbi:S-layer homology domain-containing protein [Paenibacillus sp. sptzw28]|uniref:S-layer homology domain-containing protein n=1 Tax=Paenibacillus sp. sptzw28 TaxID=715179 RepID=UPI001C6DD5BC|nr:S-layer homology domain-containing protein [Paenibacillus sp. sptzw28]QYR21521.1 S-layer homology domain-containing protein [Paenibacillus sp. sptzw28]
MKQRVVGKRLVSLLMSLFLLVGAVTPTAFAAGGGTGGGATFFTDTDNWGGLDSGGNENAVDQDLDFAAKIGNGDPLYPIEFKIENVQQIPAESAYLLIRAQDVDEYDGNSGTGEWDRVYFSSTPTDIVLGAPYTDWAQSPNSTLAGQDNTYKREFTQSTYIGALSGNNNLWNTTAIKLDSAALSRIQLGDNFVGISTHHYFEATTTFSDWVVNVDWGQLVIDGGARTTGEITTAGVEVQSGKLIIDPEFLPKTNGNFAMEINVIQEVENGGGDIVEQNLVTSQQFFPGAVQGELESPAAPIQLTNATIDPTKEYKVNIILFDNRDGSSFNPGEAQHIYTLSTFDPKVSDIVKPNAQQYAPTVFTGQEFQDKFTKINSAPLTLNKVKIVSIPDPEFGVLQSVTGIVYAGQEIPFDELDDLQFVPNPDGGFDEAVTFQWNGYDAAKGKYAQFNADVTITPNLAPSAGDIAIPVNKGTAEVPVGDLIENAYSDATDPLATVQIVQVPVTGTLVYQEGGNGDLKVAADGEEISAVELQSLKYIPSSPEQTGPVTFQWNGSDGTQYGQEPATVTISINTPPIVINTAETGLEGQPVTISKNDLVYVDDDGDTLTKVRIAVPAADKGTLQYKTVTGTTYVDEENNEINFADLESLVFYPAPGLPVSEPVVLQWEGYDGKQYSELPANITITYDGIPIAKPQVVDVEEGTLSIPVTLVGEDAENSELAYNITAQPTSGTLQQQQSGEWIYTPDPDFKWGTDKFSFTVTDSVYQQQSTPAEVIITVHRSLDGWVGDKELGDPAIVKAIPGQPLPLSAVSSLLADEVTATVDGKPVKLTLMNADTYQTDGFKKWENANFILPSATAAGQYTVTFEARKSDNSLLPAEPASKLSDNKFELVGMGLELSANPERIVGDGNSTTELTALLVDSDGNPISGVEVEFSAPKGSFVGSNKAVTNEQGKAVVTYKSEKITGINEQQIPVTAKVYDPSKGLFGQDEIKIYFQPASINGVITKGDSNQPVAGTTVRVTLDLNGDGKIEAGVDFDRTVVTDANGAYSIPVPKGDAEYNLQITQQVLVGGVETPVTFNQKAKVGEVTGSNDESFDSEKTVTGIVLFKNPDGKSSLISNELIGKTKVYLKDAGGNYVSEGGVPKAFELQAQGLFNADGLSVGDYTLEVRYELEPGVEITISRGTVGVKANGEMNITEELVDPYGTITDAVTGATIEGAKVVLHYADTQRNKDNGRTPHGKVTLPALVGFEPNNNASPEQYSDVHGFYAYMVFPETDYYLVVTKDGYQTYTSPTISVERDIVRHDLKLNPFSGGAYFPPAKPEVSLNLSVDKNLVEEGGQSTITVDYSNKSLTSMVSGNVTITLPEGVEVVDADGGQVSGNKITWAVKDLAAGQKGSFAVVVKWPQLNAQEASFDASGEFSVNGNSAEPVKAQSAIKIQVFSNRYANLQHQRYILGFPDGLFKPTRSLTRAELAAVVARLAENGEPAESLSFIDVPADFWAAKYIKIAVKNGYFGGFEDGTYRPDAPVTRGELAAVMTRFLKLNVGQSDEQHFSDVKGHWAASAIEQLYRSKYVLGYPDGTFKPGNSISRSEAVTLINRMLHRGPLKGMEVQFPDIPETHWAFGDVQEATVSHESIRNADGSETWVKNINDNVE